MKYQKKFNKIETWENYCQSNQSIIEELELPSWIFTKEGNFRNFVTTGEVGNDEIEPYNFDKLTDKKFWKLFLFTTTYFDMDTTLFTELEKSRLSRSDNN